MVTHALGRKPLDLIIATLFRNCKKSLKMLKGKSESVNRSRKDNAMAKRKRINKDIQTLHIKLKIEYTNTTKNRG
jgi:hypothetical protein